MPYVICPVCKASFHLSVRGDPKAWEAEHVKDRTESGVPLLTCIRCWVELTPGHRVTLRADHGNLPAGSEGVVQSSIGQTLVVAFGPTQLELARSNLFYVMGQPSPDAA